MDTTKCLVCLSEFMDNICPRCRIPLYIYENVICHSHNHQMTSFISSSLKDEDLKDIQRAKLSHYLHKMFHKIDVNKKYTQEDYNELQSIIINKFFALNASSSINLENGFKYKNFTIHNDTIFDLPNPMQQLDRLILFLGDNHYILT